MPDAMAKTGKLWFILMWVMGWALVPLLMGRCARASLQEL